MSRDLSDKERRAAGKAADTANQKSGGVKVDLDKNTNASFYRKMKIYPGLLDIKKHAETQIKEKEEEGINDYNKANPKNPLTVFASFIFDINAWPCTSCYQLLINNV